MTTGVGEVVTIALWQVHAEGGSQLVLEQKVEGGHVVSALKNVAIFKTQRLLKFCSFDLVRNGIITYYSGSLLLVLTSFWDLGSWILQTRSLVL